MPLAILTKLTCTQPHFYQISNTELHSDRKISVESTKRDSLRPIRKVPLALPRHQRSSRSADFYKNPLHWMLLTMDENVEYAVRTYNHTSKNNVTVAVPIFTKLIIDKVYHVTFYPAFLSNRSKNVKTKVWNSFTSFSTIWQSLCTLSWLLFCFTTYYKDFV